VVEYSLFTISCYNYLFLHHQVEFKTFQVQYERKSFMLFQTSFFIMVTFRPQSSYKFIHQLPGNSWAQKQSTIRRASYHLSFIVSVLNIFLICMPPESFCTFTNYLTWQYLKDFKIREDNMYTSAKFPSKVPDLAGMWHLIHHERHPKWPYGHKT
jgi:hypothetical protein